MSESLPPDEHESRASFRFTDRLPAICVVCGAPATGQCSLEVDAPPDADAAALTLFQMLALLFGFLFLWWRTTPGPRNQGTPDHHWLQIPRCDNHGSADQIRSAVTLWAVDRYNVGIDGASAEFIRELEALNAPPSPEILAALDAGPARDAEGFLKDIEKSNVRTPNDFLQDLEREARNR
jgi:hypothetical protein